MSQFLRRAKGAALAVTITFGAVSGSAAQDDIYITEKIGNGEPKITCARGFPDGSNPDPKLIAWVDTYYYHGGQLSPAAYALMDTDERASALKGINRLYWPTFQEAGHDYDTAVDKLAALKKMIAKVHTDMPIDRWDKMAEKCRDLMDRRP